MATSEPLDDREYETILTRGNRTQTTVQLPAQFLVLGKNASDPEKYDIIVDGIYSFPNGHEYVIGYTYYLGLLGQPTTEDTGQTLFTVLDRNKIRVHLS